MSDQPKPELTTTLQLIYLGFRRSSDGKEILSSYYKFDPATNTGAKLKWDADRESIFKKKAVPKGLQPGQIIELRATADGSHVNFSSSKPVGRWMNAEDVTTWTARHRAVVSEEEELRADIKKIKEGLPAESLAPFRRAYQSARNSRQQAHILAWVIQEITRFR